MPIVNVDTLDLTCLHGPAVGSLRATTVHTGDIGCDVSQNQQRNGRVGRSPLSSNATTSKSPLLRVATLPRPLPSTVVCAGIKRRVLARKLPITHPQARDLFKSQAMTLATFTAHALSLVRAIWRSWLLANTFTPQHPRRATTRPRRPCNAHRRAQHL